MREMVRSIILTVRPMPFAVATGLGNTSFDALAEYLALKLRKHCQQARHRPPGWGGEIQRFVEGDKPLVEVLKLLQGRRSEIHAPNPSSSRRHDVSATKRYNAFQVSCNVKITV